MAHDGGTSCACATLRGMPVCRPHRRSQSRRASKFRIAHVTAEAEPQVDEQADQQATPQPSPPQTVSSFLRGLLAPAIRPAYATAMSTRLSQPAAQFFRVIITHWLALG